MAETSSLANDEPLATSDIIPASTTNPEETEQNVQDPAPSSFSCLAKSVDLGDKEEDFPKGCRFSPDGLCVLTASRHRLLLYNSYTPSQDWKSVLSCETGDAVRSYTWYPHMNSADPSTCCFLGTSRYVGQRAPFIFVRAVVFISYSFTPSMSCVQRPTRSFV
jgi:hypothetical protein